MRPACRLLGTTIFVILKGYGQVDFTNPVSTALIGLGSPPDDVAWDACTGKYYDGKLDDKSRHFKRLPHQVRIAYGQPLPTTMANPTCSSPLRRSPSLYAGHRRERGTFSMPRCRKVSDWISGTSNSCEIMGERR
jgi:hypothetical protein